MTNIFKILPGHPYPIGSAPDKRGVNFCVFSKNATAVELLIFNQCDSSKPCQTVSLDSRNHRSGYFWHAYILGLKPGYFYSFRASGPNNPAEGMRFNPKKVLIDPYSRGIDYSLWKREDAYGDADNTKTSLRSAIINIDDYDWKGDKPLNLPLEETIIYELHVGNFTKSPTSGCKYPGKFKGIIEKIPYLKSLGITAVELMPIFDFDTGDTRNVWGYGTLGFFAPESSYCTCPGEASHVKDFRDMVRALHKAGIEVILDVVFGYTTEGDQNGPTLCFRGFDNSIYYQLAPDKNYYMNFSGCGNTLNCNHPVVTRFIIDCLKYWVEEMHIDGFRFDEGSLLSRDEKGNLVQYPPVLWNIDLSPTLASTKMFVEPWDAGGAYLVGRLPERYIEWNGYFRDNMRRFVRGDKSLISAIADHLVGSANIYRQNCCRPKSSLNFITAHDGFTLCDLVSYNQKHNEANKEDNRDGLDENFSWNCGIEGETDNQLVKDLRMRQIKNFFALLFLSEGIPLILMGDEVGRSQKGNNNAYCHDNELVWFNWKQTDSELLKFVRLIISFRKQFRLFRTRDKEIIYHGCNLYSPGWHDSESRVLAYTLNQKVQVMINMDNQNLDFQLPPVSGFWRIAINTAENPGACEIGQEKICPDQKKFNIWSKSVVVLIAK